MANELSITTGKVRPLNSAVVRRFTAGAAVSVGEAVFVETDGTVKPADASDQTQAQARGVVVAVGVAGATSASTGQVVDVVTHGPVAIGATGMTEGAVVYVSETAGDLTQTAPTGGANYPFVIGWAEGDSVVYIQPQVTIPSVSV